MTLTATKTAKAPNVTTLSIQQLIPWVGQPRKTFDDETLTTLALSIYQFTEQQGDVVTEPGILVPLIVRPTEGGLYEIAAGERRYRAVQKLIEGFTVEGQSKFYQVRADYPMPVQIRELDDLGMREIAVMENLHRETLTELDQADLFVACRNEGMLAPEIAQRYSLSKATVERRLQLGFGLGRDGRRMLEEGKITLNHAYILASTTGALKQTLIKAARGGMSVKEMRDIAKRASVLVEYALFDVEKSGLTIAEKLLDDGLPARFDNPKAALACQLDTLSGLAEQWEKESGQWTEIVGIDGQPQVLPEGFSHKAQGEAGRVYAYSLATGETVIHEQVYRVDEMAQAQAAQGQEESEESPQEGSKPRLSGYKQSVKVQAEMLKTASLASSLMQHPRAGVVNLIVTLFTRVVAVGGMSVSQKKMSLAVQDYAHRLSKQYPDLFASYSAGTLNLVSSPSDTFKALLRWEDHDLFELLTFLSCASAYADDAEYTRTVARHTGAEAEICQNFVLSAELLNDHTQAGLHALTQSIPEPVRPIIEPNSTKKEVRAVLLEKAQMLKEAHWIPDYLRF